MILGAKCVEMGVRNHIKQWDTRTKGCPGLFIIDMVVPKIKPVRTIIGARALDKLEKLGSLVGAVNNQFVRPPPIMANIVRRAILIYCVFPSDVYCGEGLNDGLNKT